MDLATRCKSTAASVRPYNKIELIANNILRGVLMSGQPTCRMQQRRQTSTPHCTKTKRHHRHTRDQIRPERECRRRHQHHT